MREIGELRQALTERRESLTQRVAEVSTLSAERDAVLLEVQEAHSRAEDAEAELQLVQERLADATQAVAERNAELQARKTVMDAHEREFRTLQQELERVKVQVRLSHGKQCCAFLMEWHATVGGVCRGLQLGFPLWVWHSPLVQDVMRNVCEVPFPGCQETETAGGMHATAFVCS